MENDIFRQDFVGQTVLHPMAVLALIVLGAAMLAVPRRYAAWPMIVMACFIAPAQRVVFLGLNFDLLRIMVLIGWSRLVIRSECTSLVWKPLDTALVAWAIGGTITYSLLYGTQQAFVNQLGHDFDVLGLYFLFRLLVRDWDDLYRLTLGFVICSIPLAICFLVERATGRNLFAFLGGVPEITLIREARMRCQGAFPHPIIAGCFWGAMVPLMGAGLWRKGMAKVAMLIGIACSGIIIITCASSTPVMAVLMGMVGALFFPIRRYMRLVRWVLLLTVIALHLSMKAPVWQLVARIDISGGSTGWHRFHLVDETINRVDEWWVSGVMNTGHWGYGLEDVTNQFVYEAVNGGMLRLVLFLIVVALAFRDAGRLWRVAGNDRWKVATAWALGISMFVHMANFWAVSYFGQIIMVWYVHLAVIATLSIPKPRDVNARGMVRRIKAPAELIARPARPPRPPRVPQPAVG